MSNAVQVPNNTNASDVNITPALVSFQGASGSESAHSGRSCSSMALIRGMSPSHAIINCPVANFPTVKDEIAPTVALIKNGPISKTPFGMRTEIKAGSGKASAPMIVGSVVENLHNVFDGDSGDTLSQSVFCDKWILGMYTCFGRMVYDPEDGRHYFDNSPPIFNNFGEGDCLDTIWGPRFAPGHRYGYSSQFDSLDTSAPAVGSATNKARKWTPPDIVRYLRDFFAATAGGPPIMSRPPMPKNVGLIDLPSYILWPINLGSALGYDRTIQDFPILNKSILQVLSELGSLVGGFDLYCAAVGNFQSEMQFVSHYAKRGTGTRWLLPSYGAVSSPGEALASGETIHSAKIKESIVNTFPGGVRIHGDSPAVERQISMDLTDDFGAGFLDKAWSATDESSFKTYITGHGNNIAAFRAACKLWPLVFAAYYIKANTNVWSNTKYSGTTISGPQHYRIKSHQLTAVNQTADNPRDCQYRGIVVESKLSPKTVAAVDAGPVPHEHWQYVSEFDRLTLSPDSKIILIPGARDQLKTFYVEYPGATPPADWRGEFSGAYMFSREVRLNAAIEGNFPIIGHDSTDPNAISQRFSATLPKFTYVAIAEEMDYIDLMRIDSKPVGRVGVDNPWDDWPDQAGAGGRDELFTDIGHNTTSSRIFRHAALRNKDMNRISIEGPIGFEGINASVHPGLAVSVEGNNTIPVVGVVRSVHFDFENQYTTAEMGDSDATPILDVNYRSAATASNPVVTAPNPAPVTTSTAKEPQTPSTPVTSGYVPSPSTQTSSGYQPSKPNDSYSDNQKKDNYDYGTNADGSDVKAPGASGAAGNAGAAFNPNKYTGEPRPYGGKDYSIPGGSGAGASNVNGDPKGDYSLKDYKGKDYSKMSDPKGDYGLKDYKGKDYSTQGGGGQEAFSASGPTWRQRMGLESQYGPYKGAGVKSPAEPAKRSVAEELSGPSKAQPRAKAGAREIDDE